MKTCDKLIRDRMPETLEKAGIIPITRQLDEKELDAALKEKLQEEVNQFLENDQIEEIADILEVLEAIVRNRGGLMGMIFEIKQERREVSGGFEKRLLLEKVADDEVS